MKAFSLHLLIDLKAGLRDKTLLLMNYLFPLGFYIIIGGIMPKLNPGYLPMLIPSMMIFSILVSTLLGLPNSLVASRDSGIFRSYKINGVSKLSMLGIPTVSTVLHTIIVIIIILLSAPILFNAKLPQDILGFIIVFIATLIVFSGFAVLIGVVAQNASTTIIYAQALFLPSMLIGGLMFPTSALPDTITKFGMLLPTTYAMDAYQVLANNQDASINPVISIGILILSGLISFYLSWYLFRFDNNNASKAKSNIWALGALIPFVLAAILI